MVEEVRWRWQWWRRRRWWWRWRRWRQWQPVTCSCAFPLASLRCVRSRSPPICGRHSSRMASRISWSWTKASTRSCRSPMSCALTNGWRSHLRSRRLPIAVLHCEKMPRSEAFLSASPGCGSTESARIAPLSSRMNCAGSTHSKVHWPCESASANTSRYLSSPHAAPIERSCEDSKARPWSSPLPRRRRRSCS